MAIIQSEQITPRESMEHEWYVDEMKRTHEHAVLLKKLEIEYKKIDLKQRQIDRVMARKHYEYIRELEYATRYEETRWRSLFRIPVMIILLPVYIILAIGCTILIVKNKEIPTDILSFIK